MKFSGTITVAAPHAQVFKALRDPGLFASCIDGVSDLAETGPDAFSAMFETKVAYMKFAFKVAVQVVRADEPREIEAKIEGSPLGIVAPRLRRWNDNLPRGWLRLSHRQLHLLEHAQKNSRRDRDVTFG